MLGTLNYSKGVNAPLQTFVVSFVPKKATAAIILRIPNDMPTAAYEPKMMSTTPPRAAPIIAPKLKKSDLIDIIVGRNFGTWSRVRH